MSIINIEKSRACVEEILCNKITGEYSWLDFKLEYKGNPEELVHDILCLSNARYAGDRYLIYGVEDGSWELKGLPEVLKSNDIYTIVNIQIWNQKPVIAVDHVHIDGKIFGFIVIADTPTKPHYLRKPYKGIPSGAVYIRQGDTNTPFRTGTEARSIEDGELETMFRERFGIDKPLLEKVEILLQQSAKWEEFREGEKSGYFHSDFPEYQIRFREPEREDEKSWEPWVELHHKQTDFIQKESVYSRVSRDESLFGWGERFSIYVHSTPIYQYGALIELYNVSCPYPKLSPENNRYHIRTDKCEDRNLRINYFVGAIICLKEREWELIHHPSEEQMAGSEVFRIYNEAMRHSINISRAELDKEPMLVLDIDVV